MTKSKDDKALLGQFQLPDNWRSPTRSVLASSEQYRGRQFVMVPLAWKERLSEAAYIGTYRVALHLLYRNWKQDRRSGPLSNMALAREGVSRWGKWRALRELELLELIKIERRPRKSPVITVINP
jgi:hypothetical protein